MQDIDDNVVNNTLSLRKKWKMVRPKYNFDDMSIGSDVTSSETISCDSISSNLNNKDQDKMVKNAFLKIFGRYYFQKFKYNAFPDKRMEEGEKKEMMDIIQWGIDKKQEENDRIKRKVQFCLDDMMDSIFVHEQENVKKETEKELVENECNGNYELTMPLVRNERSSIFYHLRDKQKLKEQIIEKNELPTTVREKSINTYFYMEKSSKIDSSKSLLKTYKEWCNRDIEKWECYLSGVNPYLNMKDKPTFSWEDKQINGIPLNSKFLLNGEKYIEDSDITWGALSFCQYIEIPLINYFGTPENDIDSKTTSESPPESSDPESNISTRSSSE